MKQYYIKISIWFWLFTGTFFYLIHQTQAADQWISFEGANGAGNGKHIVLVTGDEEYRSEESMPQLAKILALRHGFKCTVLFAIDRKDGTINPYQSDNIPGLDLLQSADLMIIFIRFRDLPDEQMKCIVDYTNSGKPMIGIRPTVAAFKIDDNSKTYIRYDYRYKGNDFYGGFGRQILGETWIKHYGSHQVESTRGHIAEGMEQHPIVKGCRDIWGPSDVYGITTLNGDCQPLIMGQVLTGMNPNDPPNSDKELVPVAWAKTYTGAKGKESRVFTSTMGHGDDFKNEGFRRLIVNACYWGLGMEKDIPEKSNVDLIGEYNPNPIGFNGHKTGVKPSDHKLPPKISWSDITSPIIFQGDSKFAYRDPAVVYHNQTFYLYFTLSESTADGGYYNMTAYSKSRDLIHWTFPRTITPRDRDLNYSSPGNIIRFDNQWLICLQTYPTPNLEKWGNQTSRIWIMRSNDLEQWSQPELLAVKGADIPVEDMGRMIDPYLFQDADGKWWCFYKQNGVSLSYSYDLKNWTYAGHRKAGENVTVLKDYEEFIMFHSPQNGIGVKRSQNIEQWGDDVQLITLGQKQWPWAQGRLTAATVVDLRDNPTIGKCVMFFHGSSKDGLKAIGAHGYASMGMAWSDDLVNWDWPGK